MFRRLLVSCAALAVISPSPLAPSPLAAQSLGEAATREKDRRAKQKASGAKAYTNEDLGAPTPSPSPSPAPGASGKKASPPPKAVALPAASQDETRKQLDNEEQARRAAEASWAARAKQDRENIARAEAKVAQIQNRIDALRTDRDPTHLLDPNRLQAIEAEIAQALSQLEAAKREVDLARKALDDLEEEARRSSIPPGWLREP